MILNIDLLSPLALFILLMESAGERIAPEGIGSKNRELEQDESDEEHKKPNLDKPKSDDTEEPLSDKPDSDDTVKPKKDESNSDDTAKPIQPSESEQPGCDGGDSDSDSDPDAPKYPPGFGSKKTPADLIYEDDSPIEEILPDGEGVDPNDKDDWLMDLLELIII